MLSVIAGRSFIEMIFPTEHPLVLARVTAFCSASRNARILACFSASEVSPAENESESN